MVVGGLPLQEYDVARQMRSRYLLKGIGFFVWFFIDTNVFERRKE